jgi:hypothetical protein
MIHIPLLLAATTTTTTNNNKNTKVSSCDNLNFNYATPQSATGFADATYTYYAYANASTTS